MDVLRGRGANSTFGNGSESREPKISKFEASGHHKNIIWLDIGVPAVCVNTSQIIMSMLTYP
jgi:hypothetical protein